jgi:hypothetical protein
MGLLSSMLGARVTTNGPEVAVVGSVTVIDVLLQELIVVRPAFNVT